MVEQITKNIQDNLDLWMTPEILNSCLGMLDLTTLKISDTPSSVTQFTEKVNNLHFSYPECNNPASICVFPNFAGVVRNALVADGVNVTVVSGCFPASQSFLEVKVKETEMAVQAGADEIDIVLAHNSFLEGRFEDCAAEIRAQREACKGKILKVILETGAMNDEKMIRDAAFLAMESGADFIKTSTGKIDTAATPFAATVMCQCIKEYYEKTGRKVGFKPAGGMSVAKDVAVYYGIVKTILGQEWLCPELLRFGASRVANSLMSEIKKETISYF